MNTPFLLGFDDVERLLERVRRSSGNSYPPYNIERLAARDGQPESLRITLAVAGFTAEDLDVSIAENQLFIRGRQRDTAQRDYLHRGIAARRFQRAFLLAEGMEVAGAELHNGLLAIVLTRPQPPRRDRRIDIAAS